MLTNCMSKPTRRDHGAPPRASGDPTKEASLEAGDVNSAEYRQTLEQKKSESALQVLFKTARLTNEWSIERLAQKQAALGRRKRCDAPAPVLRESHTKLLPHIDLEGTRITTLADRVGISKQAVSELVDEMEEVGAVTRVPDPNDGRAKLVCFTDDGRRWILEGLQHLRELEWELARVLGAARLEAFRSTCSEILQFLEVQ